MRAKRYDNRILLREGEDIVIKHGRKQYRYRYQDASGKRRAAHAPDLAELRKREKQIVRDLEDGIAVTAEAKKITLNDLFLLYLKGLRLRGSTRANYCSMWDGHVRDTIGKMKVITIQAYHIKCLYNQMTQNGYAMATIKMLHSLIVPSLDLAVDADFIRKNPANRIEVWKNYGKEARNRAAISPDEQQRLLDFVRRTPQYKAYLPILLILLGTGLRAGEFLGLTWDNIDMEQRIITIDHQLTYKNYRDGQGCKFRVLPTKTKSGKRMIPMTLDVYQAFRMLRKANMENGRHCELTVDGLTDFVLLTKNNRPMMPSALNDLLYNIVSNYNRNLQSDNEKVTPLPRISAHILRHTACTRMAEQQIGIKELQYIMGHANVQVTLDIYTHVSDIANVQDKLKRMDTVSYLLRTEAIA